MATLSRVIALSLLAAASSACRQGQAPSEYRDGTTFTPDAMQHSGDHAESPLPAGIVTRNLRLLRQATVKFQALKQAGPNGYAIFGGCFADSTKGGMGQHYANDALIADPAIKLTQPELLLYETTAEGREQLVAVEYIVFVEDWHAAGNTQPPRLFETDFHINPTLLPRPFYLLHVWVWKSNPAGLLSDWNPTVQCR